MEKQSDLQIDAMQCKFDLAGRLWLKLNRAQWQEAAFVLQAKGEDAALKKALASVKVVWVPTEQVSLMAQFVPGKRKQDWLAALPFSLEESLAEPVESLHFVVLNRTSQGLVSVAITSKNRMQQWVEQLQLVGLGHAQLVADCFQVAVPDLTALSEAEGADSNETEQSQIQQAWSLFKTDEQRCLVRTSEYAGFAGSVEWYQQLLQMQNQLHGEVEVQAIESVTEQCQTNTNSRNPCQLFNLRTGAYQARSQQSGLLKLWLWPAILLCLLVLVYLTGVILQTKQHSAQAQAYQTQTEALFKLRFPEIKRIVNLQAQAKSAFNQGADRGDQSAGPSQLIQLVEPLFKQFPTIQIQRLDWRANNSQLAITIQAPQLTELQSLAQAVKSAKVGEPAKAVQSELKVKNVSQTLAEGVLYVDAK